MAETLAVRWGVSRPVGRHRLRLHNVVPSAQALFPWLPDFWQEYITQSGFKGPNDTPYPKSAHLSAADDAGRWARPAPISRWSGRRRWRRAVNDWLIAEWLDKEPRLRASIVVPSQQPEMAPREIDRVGGHPGFVQVFLPVRSERPYGKRRYYPIFEAAVAAMTWWSASTSAARPATRRPPAAGRPTTSRSTSGWPGLPVPGHQPDRRGRVRPSSRRCGWR